MLTYANRFPFMGVYASLNRAIANLGSQPSYGLSTYFDAVSLRGGNVQCGVVIPVMGCAALRALPSPDVQRQLCKHMSATVAAFTAWVERVDFDQFLAIPGAFVVHHTGKHAHSCISDASGKLMVCHHAPDVQVLHVDHIEAFHKACGGLVNGILATVSNVLMQLGNGLADAFTAFASLLRLGKSALKQGKASEPSAKVLGVGDAIAVAERCKAVHTEINADALSGLGQLHNLCFETQTHKIPATAVLGYRNRGGGDCELAAPVDMQPSETCNKDRRVVGIVQSQAEATAGVFRALASVLLAKGRVTRRLVEKVGERALQMSQRLLRWNRTDFIEPFRCLITLPLREHGRALVVANAALFGVPCVRAFAQHAVIHIPASSKHPLKLRRLFRRRVKAELPACFHVDSHNGSLYRNVNPKRKEQPFPPLPECRGFHG